MREFLELKFSDSSSNRHTAMEYHYLQKNNTSTSSIDTINKVPLAPYYNVKTQTQSTFVYYTISLVRTLLKYNTCTSINTVIHQIVLYTKTTYIKTHEHDYPLSGF